MRYLFILIIFFGCKKEENKNVPHSVIKYEVIGECCDLEVYYLDGTLKPYNSTNYFTWSHTFNAVKGTSLEVRGRSDNGNGFTNVKIFQDGGLLKEQQGFGSQIITDVVK